MKAAKKLLVLLMMFTMILDYYPYAWTGTAHY